MKPWVFGIGVLFGLLFGSNAMANDSPESIRDLIIIGLKRNLGLQVERINVPTLQQSTIIEHAFFDPEFFAATEYQESSSPTSSLFSLSDTSDTDALGAQMGLRKQFTSGMVGTFSLSTERASDNSIIDGLDPRYRSALILDLTQPLLRNFGASANTTKLQVSQNQHKQAALGYFFQAQTLALKIELLAQQLVNEAEVIRLRKEAVDLSRELYQANKKRFESGVIPVSEVQEAETEQARRELSLSLAMQDFELRFEDLNRELNYALPERFDPGSLYRDPAEIITLKLPVFGDLYAQTLEKRLDLQISELDLTNRRLQADFFTNQLKPQLDLKLQGGLNGLSGQERTPNSSARYTGNWGESFSSLARAEGYQWGAGLQFSIPLGNREAKARQRQAVLQQKQEKYRKRDLEAALKQELLQQQTNLQRALEQIEIADRFQSLAEKTVRQEERRLEEGLSDTFRMLIIQQNMINAKIDRINALTQYHLALAQMNFTRGIILESHGIDVKLENQETDFENM